MDLKTLSSSSCQCVDWDAAAEAADALLKNVHRLDILKQLDPLDFDDYVSLVASQARSLGTKTKPIEEKHIEAALKKLDVDWQNLSDEEIAEVISAAEEELEKTANPVALAATLVLGASLLSFAKSTLNNARKTYELSNTPAKLTPSQRSDIAEIADVTAWTILEYERRLRRTRMSILDTVRQGIRDGLSSPQITESLKEITEKFGINYTPAYWTVVADNLSNRVRNYVSLSLFSAAGITKYVFVAVMDERTTIECRMLNGTIFDVQEGLDRYQRLFEKSETDPLALEKTLPFVKRRRVQGTTELYVTDSSGDDIVIGVNTVSGVGEEGVVGKYKNVLSPQELQDLGVAVPPIHHGCRSSILPVRT